MVEPIRPKDVVKAKQESLPDEVIKAFNKLIAENWDGSSSRFKQNDAVARIKKTFLPKRMTSKKMYENNWLDVEDVYRKAGWDVYYDRPAYNENYPATFKFSRVKKG